METRSTTSAVSSGHFVASARRFRPIRFDQVLGQSHVVAAVRGALQLGRVAPAYLFSGPRGVGKTTVARLIAKAVNCTARDGPEPCNRCPACRAINRGACIDVIEIDAASHTGVDNMREVCETVRFPPGEVRCKVVIIDECHMLSKGAFNAFLKTLEEPPPHVVFVLATTEPEKVPDTVKSRCQQYRFVPAKTPEIVANLERVLDAREDATFSKDRRGALLVQVAKAADGSFRDALSLLDQVLAVVGADGALEEALEVLGVTPWSVLEELAGCIGRGDAAGALAALDRRLREGVDLAQLVRGLAEYFRAIMLCALSPELAHLAALPDEARAAVADFARSMPLDHVLRCIDQWWAAADRFRQDADQRTVVEVALVKACCLGDTVQLPQLIDRLTALEQGRVSGTPGRQARKAPASRPEPAKPAPAAQTPTGDPPAVQALARTFDGSVVVRPESGSTA